MISIRCCVALLLLWLSTADVYSDQNRLTSCGSPARNLSDLALQQVPMRVLLVPLLSREPRSTESPRWAEQPARTLAAFYRNQFSADVTQLKDVWTWTDYFRQVEQLLQASAPFDRVIFIGHGGFDGPVLENFVSGQSFQITGNKGQLLQFSEAQPGLQNTLSLTYDTQNNRRFSNYMASHWRELVPMQPDEIRDLLKELEKWIQPLDHACFENYCSPKQLGTSTEQQRQSRLDLCERICRESLYELKIDAEISRERFFHFAKSLSSLASSDGLLFFGSCNPGSKAPVQTQAKNETMLLINSTLAGGPHKSYVHLVSAATGRIAAGPIGQSSADDIVNRVMMFESNRPQANLCIADPVAP